MHVIHYVVLRMMNLVVRGVVPQVAQSGLLLYKVSATFILALIV